jgi:hypothetical protein
MKRLLPCSPSLVAAAALAISLASAAPAAAD